MTAGRGGEGMTSARVVRAVAEYLRTPVGAACVAASGVAVALALLVLPAVDDGFRSQSASVPGTSLPAPTAVATTPVPTRAPQAVAADPSITPVVLLFRLATPTPRVLVPPPPAPTATPRPTVKRLPARLTPRPTEVAQRAKPTATRAPTMQRNATDAAKERAAATDKKPAVAVADPREASSDREGPVDRGGRNDANTVDRTRSDADRAVGDTTRRSDDSGNQDYDDRKAATERDRKPGDRAKDDRSGGDGSRPRDGKAKPKSGGDRRELAPRDGSNQNQAPPRTPRQER